MDFSRIGYLLTTADIVGHGAKDQKTLLANYALSDKNTALGYKRINSKNAAAYYKFLAAVDHEIGLICKAKGF